ncbi:MAG: glycosyltransferase family 9 protein [Myxococcota bacterium]
MSEQRLLFMRLSALGDVILTLPALAYARENYPDVKRTYLTRSPYASLLTQLDPALELLRYPEDIDTRATLWRWLERHPVAGVIDLHAGLRTRFWLWGLATRRAIPVVHVDSEPLLRRRHLKRWPWCWFPAPTQEALPVRQRVLETTQRALQCWLKSSPSSDTPVQTQHQKNGNVEYRLSPLGFRIALLPGAHHATKAWPIRHWQTLGQQLEAEGLEVIWLGSVQELSLLHACSWGQARALTLAGDLPTLWPQIASCQLAVGNDSGLTHLAELLNVPVVMIRGPTVGAFGFSPHLPASQVVELPLSCRPCSLHGAAACPLTHRACLETLDPSDVYSRVLSFLQRRTSHG